MKRRWRNSENGWGEAYDYLVYRCYGQQTMNTRTRHSLSIDTIETLVSRRNGTTWRAYAEQLGYAKTYAATLNKAAHGIPGAMTQAAENILRERLGLKPRNRKKYHRPCLDDAEYARFLEWRTSWTPQ